MFSLTDAVGFQVDFENFSCQFRWSASNDTDTAASSTAVAPPNPNDVSVNDAVALLLQAVESRRQQCASTRSGSFTYTFCMGLSVTQSLGKEQWVLGAAEKSSIAIGPDNVVVQRLTGGTACMPHLPKRLRSSVVSFVCKPVVTLDSVKEVGVAR